MAQILVLGAGIGGMPAAYELRKALAKEHRVTVVNFLRKMKRGSCEPVYEKVIMGLLGIRKLKG
jgi:NADH dehydrogenase FAD-containing subunit